MAGADFHEALREHQAGRLAEAEVRYRRALRKDPRHADALNLLGVLLRQLGRHEEAVVPIAKAVSLKRSAADFHFNLGEALRALGRFPEAAASYAKAVSLRPGDAEAHHALGAALEGVAAGGPPTGPAPGEISGAAAGTGGAEASYRRAVELRPGFLAARDDLVRCLLRLGRAEESEAACREAIALAPSHVPAYLNLGAALAAQGRHEEAVDAYARAIQLEPASADVHVNLAAALARRAKYAEAALLARKAVQIKPDSPEAHLNLGAALEKLGRREEAEACCRRAFSLRPSYAEAYNNLGLALDKQGRLGEAEAAYARATELRPAYAEAFSNRGNTLKAQGRLPEALASFRRAVDLKADFAEAHSNLLFALNCHDAATPTELFEEHLRWGRSHADCIDPLGHGPASQPVPSADQPPPASRPAHDGDLRHDHGRDLYRDPARDPDRRLRVGFMSPDLREHSVAFFLEPLLEALDRHRVHTVCYSDVFRPDAVTLRLHALVRGGGGLWRPTAGLSDGEVADLVRADGVDVLVDLAGHTANNRLKVFARRPAPVQVAYLGYPNTAGLSQINYRLTDAHADPPGLTDGWHAERLLRLAGGFLCYRPPADAPEVAPAPSAVPVASGGPGGITFGSFNQLAKLSPTTVGLWTEVLKAAAGSRLLLKSKGLGDGPTRQGVLDAFAARGVGPERLVLSGPEPTVAAHLGRYAQVDIALDPFPYHGTTTTCEALWMGVPVVTLAGQSHVSRVGVSLLSNAGLGELAGELVADTPCGYARLAAALAGDPQRLDRLRRGLRGRLLASPLLDASRLAREFEGALRAGTGCDS